MQMDGQTYRQADMTKLIVTFHNIQTCLRSREEPNLFTPHSSHLEKIIEKFIMPDASQLRGP